MTKDKKKKTDLKLAIEMSDMEWFSTGFLQLDEILGGGMVVGSIVEVFGEESEGKTTLGMQLLAKGQEEGYKTFYLDAEHSATRPYLSKFLDLNDLYWSRPACGEEAFDQLYEFWDRFPNEKCVIFVDSVPALKSEKVIEGESGQWADVARLLGQNIPGILRRYHNSILIFSNQLRDKVGSPHGGTKTTGGWAIKYYAGHRISIDTIKMILDSEKNLVGKTIRCKCVKNKFGRPFMECDLDLNFGLGFSQLSDIFDFARKRGIIEEAGSWYSYKNTKLQGKENFLRELKNNNEFFEEIRTRCSAKGLG